MPKFDTVLLDSNWINLQRKYFCKIPTDINALSCGPKLEKISGILEAISPARHPQNSSQHVRACAEVDGAICSKNRKIVPYHGANPNTRNGARLRSPSPIMAPVLALIVSITKFSIVIGSPRAYLSRNHRAITWVSDYRCPI